MTRTSREPTPDLLNWRSEFTLRRRQRTVASISIVATGLVAAAGTVLLTGLWRHPGATLMNSGIWEDGWQRTGTWLPTSDAQTFNVTVVAVIATLNVALVLRAEASRRHSDVVELAFWRESVSLAVFLASTVCVCVSALSFSRICQTQPHCAPDRFGAAIVNSAIALLAVALAVLAPREPVVSLQRRIADSKARISEIETRQSQTRLRTASTTKLRSFGWQLLGLVSSAALGTVLVTTTWLFSNREIAPSIPVGALLGAWWWLCITLLGLVAQYDYNVFTWLMSIVYGSAFLTVVLPIFHFLNTWIGLVAVLSATLFIYMIGAWAVCTSRRPRILAWIGRPTWTLIDRQREAEVVRQTNSIASAKHDLQSSLHSDQDLPESDTRNRPTQHYSQRTVVRHYHFHFDRSSR